MEARDQLERITRLKNRWAFNYGAWYERILKLQNLWVFNYNPWHDELGRFTFAGHGRAVWPKNLISVNFAENFKTNSHGKKDLRMDYAKLPPYRPDVAAVSVSNAYQAGLSKAINQGLREMRNATTRQELFNALNCLVKCPSGLARVPGETGNNYYTSTLVRNMSRTTAFKNEDEITLYQGVSGDKYNKRATKGAILQLNNFASTSTSATVATSYAARRGSQKGSAVQTVYSIKCPPGTAMAIPTKTKISGGLGRDAGMSDESEVVLPPSTTLRINKVGNIKTVTDGGKSYKVREIQLEVVPYESAASELAQGDYSRYDKE